MNPILANILQSGGSTTTDWSSIQPEKISHLHEGEVLKSFSFLFRSFKASFFTCVRQVNFHREISGNETETAPTNRPGIRKMLSSNWSKLQPLLPKRNTSTKPGKRKRNPSTENVEEVENVEKRNGKSTIPKAWKECCIAERCLDSNSFPIVIFCMAELRLTRHFPRVAAPEVKKGKKLKAGKAKKSLESMNLDKHPSHQHISRVSNRCNPSLVTSAPSCCWRFSMFCQPRIQLEMGRWEIMETCSEFGTTACAPCWGWIIWIQVWQCH